MLKPRKLARGAAFALSLAALAPIATPALVTHAQAASPAPSAPANFVSVSGDGWTIMAPPDWTYTVDSPSAGYIKGPLPTSGAAGQVLIFRAAPLPTPAYNVADLLGDFKDSNLFTGAVFGTDANGPFRGQPAAYNTYAAPRGAGDFTVWIENGQAWGVLFSVLSTDTAVVDAGLDSMHVMLPTLNPN
jgi:hypothetical protein